MRCLDVFITKPGIIIFITSPPRIASGPNRAVRYIEERRHPRSHPSRMSFSPALPGPDSATLVEAVVGAGPRNPTPARLRGSVPRSLARLACLAPDMPRPDREECVLADCARKPPGLPLPCPVVSPLPRTGARPLPRPAREAPPPRGDVPLAATLLRCLSR